MLIGTNRSEAPAARRADARCAPRSVASLPRCGAYVVIRTLRVLIGSRELRSRERLCPPRGCPFESRPATAQHLMPPQPRQSPSLRSGD
ncbi:hypothetical protein BN903_113 [Halorubrum sp. AJ67]|nr:hypothetical protein BN903_113 [Halorubrum sp. AJ67]